MSQSRQSQQLRAGARETENSVARPKGHGSQQSVHERAIECARTRGRFMHATKVACLDRLVQ